MKRSMHMRKIYVRMYKFVFYTVICVHLVNSVCVVQDATNVVYVCSDSSSMNSSTVYLDTSSITTESPDSCHCALIPQSDRITLSVNLAQKSEPANISFGELSFVSDSIGSIGRPVEAPLLVIFNEPGNSTCVELNSLNGAIDVICSNDSSIINTKIQEETNKQSSITISPTTHTLSGKERTKDNDDTSISKDTIILIIGLSVGLVLLVTIIIVVLRKTRRQASRYKLKERDVRVNKNTTELEREDEHAQTGHVSDVSNDNESVNTPSKKLSQPNRQQD